jgi:hypothetical protein
MTSLTNIITCFTASKFIEEVTKSNFSVSLIETTLNKFSKECEQLGGNSDLFIEIATREMDACRLLEQEGGAPVSAPIANSEAGGGIAGLKPEDLGVPVEAQKRHTARNSIFKRKKPNTYFKDKDNSY